MEPKEIVRRGYDIISLAYRGDVEDEECALAHGWLDELIPLLEAGAAVLDLGCGNGIPAAKRLAATFQVTGVDISPVQVGRARKLVPQAEFICADMGNIEFPPASFAAILSLYAIIHVPLEEQPELFDKLYRWLQPGGYFMATVGHDAWTGTQEDWLGVPGGRMYWSHADRATYETWLAKSGFTILWTRFVPEGAGGHTLVLASRKPAPARWKLLDSKPERVGYRTILRNRYMLPDGEVAQFDLKGESPCVCILALTDEQQVLLVQQYRPGPDRVLIEMPGGGVEPDEDPGHAAERELIEETGYSGEFQLAGTSFHCGHSTRVTHTFVATNCRQVAQQRLDREEFINIVLMPLDLFRQHLRSGQLTDAESGYLGLDFLELL